MNNTSRNVAKKIAQEIELLAKELQLKLDSDDTSYLSLANELARNNITLVFSLGETYALEVADSDKKQKTTNLNYHNVRDNCGRFTHTNRCV